MNIIPPAPMVRISLSMLEELTAQLPGVMVLVVDAEGRVKSCSASFLKQSGYTSQAIVGRSIHELAVGRLKRQASRRLQAGALGNQGAAEKVRLIKAGGAAINVTVTRFVLEEPGGGEVLLLQRLEPHAGNPVERFGETILNDEHLGIILLQTEDMRIVEISPMACRLLGSLKHDVVNEPLVRFFGHAENEYGIIRSALEGGKPVRNFPVTWLRGEERTELLMDVGLLSGPLGGIEGAYIMLTDVTNLRSLEEQVQRSDRLAMIGQIAAGAAHEIRNPLTSIRGFLQMFRKTLQSRDMQKEAEYTEIMLTELDRINNLVGEFLLLSKPRNVIYDDVDITMVLRDIMPMIASEALLHGVTATWEIDQDLPCVTADRELLKQVFLNICKNGIEAMTNGGVLTIKGRKETEGEDAWIVIDIHDTGPGIPPHMLEKIFDPFVTTKESGTGLGLSVCQRILHDLGGTIKAVTKETGALFSIKLPC